MPRPMHNLVLKRDRPTRTHAFSTFLVFGVDQIIVCINKMDTCGWSEKCLNKIND